MYKKKKYEVYNDSYKNYKLDPEVVNKTPITTPFRIPIPGLVKNGKKMLKFGIQIPVLQMELEPH
jgi:hypothetical protein